MSNTLKPKKFPKLAKRDEVIQLNQKMRDALNSLRIIAMNHPAFNIDLFKAKDLENIQEIGGDAADWTILAIIADEGLK